jgi:hypothetical protein
MEFVKGLYAKRNEKAPDFVKVNLSFKSSDFIEWIKNNTNAKGYCNIDILESKEGKIYPKLNDWKPTAEGTQTETTQCPF